MIVLSSKNGKLALKPALDLLKSGATALDAVERATRIVERNPDDHTVGLGGLPNLLGEVCLDASIMDGRTLRAGAVGSVQHYVHVITLARRVMEQTPHVFLVGDGAQRLAAEMGLERENLLTPEAAAQWRDGLQRHFPDLDPAQISAQKDLSTMVQRLNKPMEGWQREESHGTVNFIARDREGNLATAVSTSGWPWSYPGRLGDSPVVCSGGYADNRWGAATSTGTGEVVLRTAAARSIALYMKTGMDVAAATCEALGDLRDLDDPYVDHIAIIAIDRHGHHIGYAHRRNERYAYITDAMDEPAEADMPAP